MQNVEQFTVELGITGDGASVKKIGKVQSSLKDTYDIAKEPINVDIDAQKANAQLDKIHEHLARLGIDIKGISEKFDSLFNFGKMALLLGVFVELVEIVIKLVQGVDEFNTKLIDLTNKAHGMNMEASNLRAWEYGFRAIGLSADDADNSLSSLYDSMVAMRLSPNSELSSQLGLLGITSTIGKDGKTKSGAEIEKEIYSKNYYDKKTGKFKSYSGYDEEIVRYLISQVTHTSTSGVEDILTHPDLFFKTINQANSKLAKQTYDNSKNAYDENAFKIGQEAELGLAKDTVFKALSDGVHSLIEPVGRIADDLDQIVNSWLGKIAHPVKAIEQVFAPTSAQRVMLNDADKIQAAMQYVWGKEDPTGNLNAQYDGHYGLGQYDLKTWKGYGMNPNDIFDKGAQAIAFRKEMEWYKKVYGYIPSPQLAAFFHMMGYPNFNKILKLSQSGANFKTYGEALHAIDPTGHLQYINRGRVNDILPSEIIGNEQLYRTQHPSISNNTSAPVVINHATIVANDPKQLHKEINNMKKNGYTTGASGRQS
jgi:hypothetical protein